LDDASGCQCLRAAANAGDLGRGKITTKMVNNRLKGTLVAEVERSKVAEKANPLSLSIGVFHRVLLSVRYVILKATGVI
jgi:hypothetical protein